MYKTVKTLTILKAEYQCIALMINKRLTSEEAELILAPSERPFLRYMLVAEPTVGGAHARAMVALSRTPHTNNHPYLRRKRQYYFYLFSISAAIVVVTRSI